MPVQKLDETRVLVTPEVTPVVVSLADLNTKLAELNIELERLLNGDDVNRTRDEISDLGALISKYKSAPEASPATKELYMIEADTNQV